MSKDVLPDSVSSDFQNLNKLNEQVSPAAVIAGFKMEPLKISAVNRLTFVFFSSLGALKKNLTAEQIREDLLTLGLNPPSWAEHQAALCRLALGQTLTVNQLVDMEWKFGVTVGTSEIQKVGNIFLQLKLVVRKGNSTENVYMELTLPQFYNFLHEMERAKASMECFS
uniref:COMM domain containing 7 n=1 Tax=Stegastes partitus TaxID=144197 RepID=A0A3B5AD90_9TELE